MKTIQTITYDTPLDFDQPTDLSYTEFTKCSVLLFVNNRLAGKVKLANDPISNVSYICINYKVIYLHDIKLEDFREFPNGFYSWQRTHFEMATNIQYALDKGKATHKLKQFCEEVDDESIWNMCLGLTDQFERTHKFHGFDQQYLDDIDEFMRDLINL